MLDRRGGRDCKRRRGLKVLRVRGDTWAVVVFRATKAFREFPETVLKAFRGFGERKACKAFRACRGLMVLSALTGYRAFKASREFKVRKV